MKKQALLVLRGRDQELASVPGSFKTRRLVVLNMQRCSRPHRSTCLCMEESFTGSAFIKGLCETLNVRVAAFTTLKVRPQLVRCWTVRAPTDRITCFIGSIDSSY